MLHRRVIGSRQHSAPSTVRVREKQRERESLDTAVLHAAIWTTTLIIVRPEHVSPACCGTRPALPHSLAHAGTQSRTRRHSIMSTRTYVARRGPDHRRAVQPPTYATIARAWKGGPVVLQPCSPHVSAAGPPGQQLVRK